MHYQKFHNTGDKEDSLKAFKEENASHNIWRIRKALASADKKMQSSLKKLSRDEKKESEVG